MPSKVMTAVILSVLSLSTSLTAVNPVNEASQDHSPGNTPPCAPKKPATQAAARKVVRPDAGPWDAPDCVWGLTEYPATAALVAPSLYITVNTRQNVFELSTMPPSGEHICPLNTDWQEMPLDTQHIIQLIYKGTPQQATPWETNPAFFTSHLPNLFSLQAWNFAPLWPAPLPAVEVLNPTKLMALSVHVRVHGENLPHLTRYKNLRSLEVFIDTLDLPDADMIPADFLEPLTSLEMLQALRLSAPPSFWSSACLTSVKKIIQNNDNLREFKLDCAHPLKRVDIDVSDVLSEHPFSHVYVKGFSFKSLKNLDVSRLQCLTVRNSGELEKGFLTQPTQLREVVLRDTKAPPAVLETLPLAQLRKLELFHPEDLSMLSCATNLWSLWITAEENTSPTCITNLDVVPLNEKLKISLYNVLPKDLELLKPVFQRKPALKEKVTYYPQ